MLSEDLQVIMIADVHYKLANGCYLRLFKDIVIN